MKKILACLLSAALCVVCGNAQVTPTGALLGLPDQAGILYASNFGQWQVPAGNLGQYSWKQSSYCYVGIPSGNPVITMLAFTVGTPIEIVDTDNASLNEIVTPSAVNTVNGCSIIISPAYGHNHFYLTSGTAGLQEALNWAGSAAYIVAITPDWTLLGGTSAMITAATAGANTTIFDQRGPIAYNVNVSAAAPGTERAITGSVTTTGTTYANGGSSLVGVRGLATVGAATTVTGGYIYGAQGKLVLSGTVNGSGWLFGNQGQLDLSTATLTAAAHVAPLWSDAGATGPAVSCAFCDGIIITNTTVTTFHDIVYAYSKAAYFADLTDNGGGYLASGSGSTAAVSGYIKVKINGTDAYIRVYAAAN